jgi:hypothetical protein
VRCTENDDEEDDEMKDDAGAAGGLLGIMSMSRRRRRRRRSSRSSRMRDMVQCSSMSFRRRSIQQENFGCWKDQCRHWRWMNDHGLVLWHGCHG